MKYAKMLKELSDSNHKLDNRIASHDPLSVMNFSDSPPPTNLIVPTPMPRVPLERIENIHIEGCMFDQRPRKVEVIQSVK